MGHGLNTAFNFGKWEEDYCRQDTKNSLCSNRITFTGLNTLRQLLITVSEHFHVSNPQETKHIGLLPMQTIIVIFTFLYSLASNSLKKKKKNL